MRKSLLFLLCAYSYYAIGQNPLPQPTTNYLTQHGINRIMNRAFGNLVTGQATSTQIANYASFDPVDGSFSFKGVVPIGKEEKGRLSYLSLRLGGDLISNSYSALFTNTKLNTNGFIQAEWNFRPFGKEFIVHLSSDKADMRLKRDLLQREYVRSLIQIDTNLSRLRESGQAYLDKRMALENDWRRKTLQQRAIADRLNTIRGSAVTDFDSLKRYTDSLLNNRAAIVSIEAALSTNQRMLDSVTIVSGNTSDHRDFFRRSAEEGYKNKIKTLEDSAKITGISFNWLTVLGSVGKKKYYRFDASLPYSQQIDDEEFGTWRWGLAWNFYVQSFLWKNAFYANIGFARIKENNTALLSTQQIAQVRTLKNSAGDTVRTLTKTYNAYTDPIVELNKTSIFANVYYAFGGRISGFHFFPEINYIDGGTAVTNLGVGYVVSFVNEKKDKPIINAEAYINFLDVGNKDEIVGDKFWKRNEIGVRFTLPFTFLLK